MYKEKIRGIITPIITPMREDESVNEEELRNCVKRQIAAGVHGVFPFGTTGEGYILGEEEKERVLSVVIEEAKGKVPVYAGTGCISTKDTIRLSKRAQDMGADVLSIITPSFAQASQQELYEHYKAVAAAAEIPIVLYNIPARTGNALAPETVERLSELEGIAGVKDSSGNFDNMLQYIERTRDRDFAVLSGNDSLILWNLLAGGTGAVAGCANVYPENLRNIYGYFVEGRLEEARRCQDAIRSLRGCMKYGNSQTVVKTAVRLMGYPVGACRKPFDYLPEEGIRAISKVLEENERLGMR